MATCCWGDIPSSCLKIVGRQLNARDAISARVTCRNWSQGLCLPRININLSHTGSSSKASSSDQDQDQLHQQYSTLLASLQQPSSSSRGARECIITVPVGGLALPGQQHSDDQALMAQLAATLPRLPSLESLTVKTSSSSSSSSSSSAAAAGLLPCVLQPLLLQPGLQARLQSLTLSLHYWPCSQQLAASLLQLQQLRRLSLQHCPVPVMCRLPSLPALQQLSITGLVNEPVPRSYSYRRSPLLPPLPGLTSLVLCGLPLDVRLQELEDIEEQQQQQQQARRQAADLQQRVVGSGNRQSSSTHISQRGQWVGSSIAMQCPSLKNLSTDAELGPALLCLTQLTALHGVHPAWLEAAARAAAGSVATGAAAAVGAASELGNAHGLPSMPQLQLLRHLGVGADTAADCSLLAQLTGLRSLMVWSSSSCRQRQQQATAAVMCTSSTNSSSSKPCLPEALSPSMSLVLSGGLSGSLRSLLVEAAWGISSSDVQLVLQQCGQLQRLRVAGRTCTVRAC